MGNTSSITTRYKVKNYVITNNNIPCLFYKNSSKPYDASVCCPLIGGFPSRIEVSIPDYYNALPYLLSNHNIQYSLDGLCIMSNIHEKMFPVLRVIHLGSDIQFICTCYNK